MQNFSSIDYLKIDIAGAYGLDKELWGDRLLWFEMHKHELHKMEQTADDKFIFMKGVNAYEKSLQGVPTGHIMAIDATASFLQIMAALTGCLKSAEQCNLINTGRREDFYTNLTNEMNRLLKTTINIPRKRVKEAAMPCFYGSVRMPEIVFGPETPELKAFYTALNSLAPGAVALMDTIRNYWDKTAYTHSWTLPDKHRAVVPVMDEVKLKVAFPLSDIKVEYTSTINQPKDGNVSLIANIIQSLDAWLVRAMTRLSNIQGFELLCIHDAYYASPKYMNLVRRNYRNLLVELASTNVLEQIFSELSDKPETFTKLSSSLPSLIMDSEYTLS